MKEDEKPFGSDPEDGQVRHHAEIHDDLLRSNIRNYKLQLRVRELERQVERERRERRRVLKEKIVTAVAWITLPITFPFSLLVTFFLCWAADDR